MDGPTLFGKHNKTGTSIVRFCPFLAHLALIVLSSGRLVCVCVGQGKGEVRRGWG